MNLPLLVITRLVWNLTFVLLVFITISSCRPDDYPKRQFGTDSAIDLKTGLVAHLAFDNNTWDSSPSNDNHGNIIPSSSRNFITDRKGRPLSAYRFDGASYIVINDNASLRSPIVSIAFWFKTDIIPSSSDRFMHLVYKADYESDQYKQYSASLDWHTTLGIRVKADVRQVNCENEWQNLHRNNFTMNNDWYHLAIVFNGNKGEMYINGLKQADTTFSNTSIAGCPGGNITLGSQTKDYPNNFKGAMDDFRIYNVALTQEQITELSKP